MDAKRMLAPLKGHYEKITGIVVLAGLLLTLVLLGVRLLAQRQEQQDFTRWLEQLKPLDPEVPDVSPAEFDEAIAALKDPAQFDVPPAGGWLFVPEDRRPCKGCGKPVDLVAKECPFCLEKWTAPVDRDDTDRDGMPNEWEIRHKLDPDNPDDAYYDTDGDGFVNLREWEWKSDPRDPESCPPAPVDGNLVVIEATEKAFDFVFMEATTTREGGFLFQINDVRNEQTLWKRIGQELPGTAFTIAAYTNKFAPATDESMARQDVSELTLRSEKKEITLVRGKRRTSHEQSAVLLYKPERMKITVEKGGKLVLKNREYDVKEIDARRKTVVIVALPQTEEGEAPVTFTLSVDRPDE